MPSAEIIAIGTELLLGEIQDTNTQYLARQLRDLGINLFRTSIVGDNPDRIHAVVSEALSRADIIITTGGLGPTVDDPTRQALADVVNHPLEFHPDLWEAIIQRFSRTGRTPGDNQKKQAYLPAGSQVILNPVGTAPAFILPVSERSIIALPGVPTEMKTLFVNSVIPYLVEKYPLKNTIVVRVIHTAGAGEGWIDEHIQDLELMDNPTVGLSAHAGIVDIRISCFAQNRSDALALIAPVETTIYSRLGKYIFGADQESLPEKVLELINFKGVQLITLETGTQGLLRDTLSDIASTHYNKNASLVTQPEVFLHSLTSIQILNETTTYLALSVHPDHENIRIMVHIINSSSTIKHQLTYAGHPQNAAQVGVNVALNHLRLSLSDMP